MRVLAGLLVCVMTVAMGCQSSKVVCPTNSTTVATASPDPELLRMLAGTATCRATLDRPSASSTSPDDEQLGPEWGTKIDGVQYMVSFSWLPVPGNSQAWKLRVANREEADAVLQLDEQAPVVIPAGSVRYFPVSFDDKRQSIRVRSTMHERSIPKK